MESQILIARISDTAEICERTNKPKFFGFLSPEQTVLADKFLENRKLNYRFFGGFCEAQRVMLGCFPDWAEELSFPICAVTFTFRKTDSLSHRDFLGALMALGIKRETIGDILVEEGRAVVFLADDIKKFVLTQISKIGRVGVTLSEGFCEPLPQASKLVNATDTVASNRLDCIVSALAHVSRGKAVEFIENSFVSVNSVVCEKTTKIVSCDDIVTIRGKGKFIITALNEKTKKQRTVLEFKKYI
jgi:RNA-binding protein YlmH